MTAPANLSERNYRLWQTLDMIEANPRHHMQSAWHCGTSHCFAGFADLIAHELPLNTRLFGGMGTISLFGLTVHHAFVGVRGFTATGDYLGGHTRSFAQKWLGLNTEEAHELFAGTNTLYDLRRIINDITGGDRGEQHEPRRASAVPDVQHQEVCQPVPRVRRARRHALLNV